MRVFLLALTMGLVLIAAPARAADVDGTWSGSLETPMGAVPIRFAFTAVGATLAGSMAGPDGAEIPIKNGKIDGDRISFVVSFDIAGMALDLNCTGVVRQDSLQMASDFMGMPFRFVLRKAA